MGNEETEQKQSRTGWIIGAFLLAVIIALVIPSFMRARTIDPHPISHYINNHIPLFLSARTIDPRPISRCINNLRQIESGKDQMAMDIGLTNGWAGWDGVDGYNPATDDIAAFSNMVDGVTGYIKRYPLCLSSTTEVENAAQSAHDYQVNPIGSNPVCKIRGGSGPDDHALSK